MSPNDIVADLRRQPFEPFRMTLIDGSSYDIRHPDQCLVLMTAVIVGVTNNPDPAFFDRYVKLDCRHVMRIEPLPATAAPGTNGQAP